jgi:hypothetical protein
VTTPWIQTQPGFFTNLAIRSEVLSKILSALNSLTAKFVPAGSKLVLFGRYVLNIYVGIVGYILRKTKTWHAKIYLPTQRTNWQIL